MAQSETKVEAEFDRSKLGQVLGEEEITITEDAILRYAKAIGEKDPRYTTPGPDLIAPPGICTILEAPQRFLDVKFPFAKTSMHAGSALFCYEPIHVGDKLRVTVKLVDVYTKTGRSGNMGFVVYENEFIRQDGVVVARIQDSRAHRP
ncbi:MAG TPA: MaoC family dehydratase N-terminal domain-containing protein [Thermoleophilia bacterium]|nr:MaoC family dehydratase N-terminal domain-containing protein [Thermoleophilia bacterium]